MGGIMKEAVEMVSSTMIHISSFIKFGSGFQNLFGWGRVYTCRQAAR
jgi:hypothetical protein